MGTIHNFESKSYEESDLIFTLLRLILSKRLGRDTEKVKKSLNSKIYKF